MCRFRHAFFITSHKTHTGKSRIHITVNIEHLHKKSKALDTGTAAHFSYDFRLLLITTRIAMTTKSPIHGSVITSAGLNSIADMTPMKTMVRKKARLSRTRQTFVSRPPVS